jgi:NADH-quinone oxidoreductase subunit A
VKHVALIEDLAAVITLLLVGLITDVAIVLVARYVAARRPSPVKELRYEAGNPPVGAPKYVLPVQYIGFLVMFLGIEPVVALLLVLASWGLTPLLLALALPILPGIYVTYRLSLKLAYPRGEPRST